MSRETGELDLAALVRTQRVVLDRARERELLRAAQAGDRGAADLLVRSLLPACVRFAAQARARYPHVDYRDAFSVAQDAARRCVAAYDLEGRSCRLLAAWRRASWRDMDAEEARLRPGVSVGRRGRARGDGLRVVAFDPARHSPAVDPRRDDDDGSAAVDAAVRAYGLLGRLRPQHAAVLAARFNLDGRGEERTVPETAAAVGLHPKTAGSRLAAAIRSARRLA